MLEYERDSIDKDDFDLFFQRYNRASIKARELMLLCEVEKIWIINDLTPEGHLNITQLNTYFK